MKPVLIILLIIAIALVLGPITMLRPNAAQKRLESLRIRARSKGVHFTMRNLPQQADASEPPPAIPVYFCAPKGLQVRDAWLLLRTNYSHEIHVAGYWQWHGEARPTQAELELLQGFLPKLPASVKAVGGGQGAAVYWDETGGDVALDVILELLEKLTDAGD